MDTAMIFSLWSDSGIDRTCEFDDDDDGDYNNSSPVITKLFLRPQIFFLKARATAACRT